MTTTTPTNSQQRQQQPNPQSDISSSSSSSSVPSYPSNNTSASAETASTTATQQSVTTVPQSTPQESANATTTATYTRRSTVSKGKYTLADFQILRTLGTGSFGRVHLVRSVHNNRYYAIKVLKSPNCPHAPGRAHQRRAANAQARRASLLNPHVGYLSRLLQFVHGHGLY